jgi:hypothetical protein
MVKVNWQAQFLFEEPLISTENVAQRLRDLMDGLSEWASAVYGGALRWKAEHNDADCETIADILRCIDEGRIRDDVGWSRSEFFASGVLYGNLPDASRLLKLRWDIHDLSPHLQILVEFSPLSKTSPAKSLQEHTPEALAVLLHRGVQAIDAGRARIFARPLTKALRAATGKTFFTLGEGSFIRDGVKLPEIPPSFKVFPGEAGIVLIADLERAVNDPESLVPEILVIAEALPAASPG